MVTGKGAAKLLGEFPKTLKPDLTVPKQLHWNERLLSSQQYLFRTRSFQQFMERESSLPYLQEPATGPYPLTDQSRPYNPILFL
jgi:hypothetical protein